MTARPPAAFGTSQNPDQDNSWSAALPSDGAFEVAGMGGWMARRAMQMNPEIEPNVRSTVRGLVGSGFSDRELGTLQERALEAVEIDDLVGLRGIEAGVPVTLTPGQKARIDRLMDAMGDDALGGRARDAYGRSLQDGKIRIR